MTDRPEIPGGPGDAPSPPAGQGPPKPEQIWPPPPQPSAADELGAGAVELNWDDQADPGAKPGDGRRADLAGAGGSLSAACRVRPASVQDLGRLWGNIFFAVESPPPKAVVVAGAQRKEGATQIAAALALMGAEANHELKIALIDLNLRHPAVGDVLGIGSDPGLTDVLDGRLTLEAALRSVVLSNGNRLHVLTSGSLADQPLGLLKSRQLRAVVSQLLDRFDHVLIDVAAANAFPDAQVIGTLADGVLLVVKAGETPRETAAEAKKRLDLAGARCLGLVLNQRSDPIPSLLYRVT